MFLDIKAIKVGKLLHICAIVYNWWCLVYITLKKKIIIWLNIYLKNTNIFGLTKKGGYEYKYIWFEEEKKANMNTNICDTLSW